MSDAVQLCAGTGHACALRVGGRVSCWGLSDQGQVGSGATAGNVPTPVEVISSGAASVSCGTSHTAALMADGTTRTWWGLVEGRAGTCFENGWDLGNPALPHAALGAQALGTHPPP